MSLLLILLSLSAAAANPPTDVGVPLEVLNPPWLETRRQAQVAAVADYAVFCDFSFADRQPASGIAFHHRIVDDSGRHYRPNHYDHGNGIALADVDGDGRTDLYFVNQTGPNGLWRNAGDGQFADITEQGGVALADRIGVTASFADLDNDGAPDLYVTNVRVGNVLFRNQGDGRFADISQESGPQSPRAFFGGPLLRLRPRRTTRSLFDQCRAVHRARRFNRGYWLCARRATRAVPLLRRLQRRLCRAPQARAHRAEPALPQCRGKPLCRCDRRGWDQSQWLVRRRNAARRQRRRLARPVRAQHAGARSILRKRPRPVLYRQEPSDFPAHAVGGHVGSDPRL